MFNAAVVIHRGRVLGAVPKSYLPEYREFYEKRQFRAARDAVRDRRRAARRDGSVRVRPAVRAHATSPDFTLHVEICEDLWAPIPPSTYGALAGATVLANLSASNITVGKADYRHVLCASQSARTISAYIYTAAGLGRIDHRPGLGRAGADLRERRAACRGRALLRRRAADHGRRRPRPDLCRPGRHEQLRRLDPRPPRPPRARCAGSSSSSALADRQARLERASRALPVRARRSGHAATSAARRSTTSRCGASRRGCRRPGSRRS